MDAATDGSGVMFDRIAARYDLMNRIISFGMDGRWRRALCEALALDDYSALRARDDHSAPRALDVASGTADIAIAIARTYPSCEVVGLDPSAGMLGVGRAKLAKLELGARVELIEGDARAMPFADDSFDASCIAFGIRNVPDRARGLSEMARVTRSGGRVVVLELGEPSVGPLSPLARFHIHQVMPRLGALISGDPAYRYLEQSIAAFPPADAFIALMERAGLDVEAHVPFCFGAANLFISRA